MASTDERGERGDGERRNRRTEVIATATRLFLETGYSGTSMSVVAKECGLTKATLYHHFPSKEDLFVACVTDGYSEALREVRQILDHPKLGAQDKMRKVLEALYTNIIQSPVGRMSPLIAEVSRKFPAVASSFHQNYVVPQQALISELLDEGERRGEFKTVDRQLYSHLAIGPIVTLSLSREMFATFDDLDERFPVETLRRGHVNVLLSLLTNGSHENADPGLGDGR